MKKSLLLLVTFAATSCLTLPAQAGKRSVPAIYRGNWIDTTSNLWALSLWDEFAVIDASFWDYGKWKGRGKSATTWLNRKDGIVRKLGFELPNDSTLVVKDGQRRYALLRESPAIARRPFTAPPDTTPFRTAPWVNDSIRVEGFITGYRPGDAVYHYWSPALFGFENPNTPMNVDSLGRFRVSIPSTHAQIHIVGTDVAAEPGDRIFIAYSSEGKRHLFMGDNARVNQELDRHRPARVARQFFPKTDPNEHIDDAMTWRFLRMSAQTIAMISFQNYSNKHNLSWKTQQAVRAVIKHLTIAEIALMPDKHPYLGYPYSYYLPDGRVDYSDPGIFFCSVNHTLLYPFLFLWRGHEPLYIAERAGFQGVDRETFLNARYFKFKDPERFTDFMDRNSARIDSVYQTNTSETFVQRAVTIADTMVPTGGLNRDIIFAQGLAKLWSANEEPFSEEALALIDSTLHGSPFLRDTLRGLNERYRILAERNASLELPKGAIDSTLMLSDSIVAAMLRPYAGKAVFMLFVEPGNSAADKELSYLSSVREKLKDAAVQFILVSEDLNLRKWRNTIAAYDLIGEHTIHYVLTSEQIQALLQKYWNGSGFFLLFGPSGNAVTGTVPKPSEEEALIQRIKELIGS